MDILKDVIRYIEEDIPLVVYEKGSDDPLLGIMIKIMLEEVMDEF